MPLKMWTIYDHPSDYPDCFVAREFVLDKPTENFIACNDIDSLRGQLLDMGLTCVPRSPEDQPQIVETWL